MTKKLVTTSTFEGYNLANSESEHWKYILDDLHFLETQPWVNPNDFDVAAKIANMVLEVVAYFQSQANADALRKRKGKTTSEAYNTTTMNFGQNERREVTLNDLVTLVPSKGQNAWLTDRLMNSRIHLLAPAYQPDLVWFYSDGLLQTCMTALSKMTDSGCTDADFEQTLPT